jgi:hypothetical protein
MMDNDITTQHATALLVEAMLDEDTETSMRLGIAHRVMGYTCTTDDQKATARGLVIELMDSEDIDTQVGAASTLLHHVEAEARQVEARQGKLRRRKRPRPNVG